MVAKSFAGMGLKTLTNCWCEGKPYLVDWRSQDLGSKGQPNCIKEFTVRVHLYSEEVKRLTAWVLMILTSNTVTRGKESPMLE